MMISMYIRRRRTLAAGSGTLILALAAGSVPVRPGYSLWFGCLGPGGFLTVKSPPLDLDTQLPCSGNGQLSGWVFNPPHGATGTSAVLRVGAPAGSRWELRLDAAPPRA